MRSRRRRLVFLLLLVSSCFAASDGFAICTLNNSDLEAHNLYSCSRHSYIAPTTASGVPVPISFDPNGRPANVTAVFWQIGFGNDTENTGAGRGGTGMSGPADFNGNDQGLAAPDLLRAHLADPQLPLSGLCLLGAWGYLADGCCDNDRTSDLEVDRDRLLNPYFDVANSLPYDQVYTLDRQQDYPIAVLLRESTGHFFAVAAVASQSRHTTGIQTNQDCTDSPTVTNPATCDFTFGNFDLADVADGLQNPLTPEKNVIPWQETPQPQVLSLQPANPQIPAAGTVVDLAWPGARIYSDLSHRPSTNPTLAPAEPNAAPGVGVADIASRFPLVRYVVETAAGSDPGFASPTSAHETTGTTLAGLNLAHGECLRIRTLFGKKPQVTTPSLANCRLGLCGDIGYEVVSERICPAVPCSPTPEVCDGIDNDCDGFVDDNPQGVGAPCTTGIPGVCSTGTTVCSAGHLECDPAASPSPEICDGLDNDCDGQTDEGAVGAAIQSITPSTLNAGTQGNSVTVDLVLTNGCSAGSPPVDPALLGPVHVSSVAGTALPDPALIPCPGPGGETDFETGLFDDAAHRTVNGNVIRLRFDRAPDGNCETLDGDRQDLQALVAAVLDGSSVPVCVAGSVAGAPFQACFPVTVVDHGNR